MYNQCNQIKYKDYLGEFEYDADAGIYHGRVINIIGVVTFQGSSVTDLKTSLADSVDDYIEFCISVG